MSKSKPGPREHKKTDKDVEELEEEEQRRSGLLKRLSINSESFVMCRVGNFDEHYNIGCKLGEGTFGTVYKVIHKTLHLERALKMIKKKGSSHFSAFEEIEVLKKLDHANILKIYEFYEAPESYYIITEIFEGKELFDLILEYSPRYLGKTNSQKTTLPIF